MSLRPRINAFVIAATLLIASVLRAELSLPSGEKLTLPPEGRWSVALGWKNNWPTDWRHLQPSRTETINDWTAYYATLELPDGKLELRDTTRLRPDGLLELRRRWDWKGKKPLDRVTLSIRFQLACDSARPFLPGISYYNNPAGQTVDPTIIPVIPEKIGGRGYYEEHRYPMPFAAIEAVSADKHILGAALHSLPSPLLYGHREDQWWSLGLTRLDKAVELALLSGPVSSNGQDSVIKARQMEFIPFGDTYLTLEPGATIEKTCFIQLYPVATRGSGHSPAIASSVKLFNPSIPDLLTPYRDVLQAKFNDSLRRWTDDGQCIGINAWPAPRKAINLGWAGQSEALAYPMLVLGKEFGIKDPVTYAQKSLDFITTSPFGPEGFRSNYSIDKHEWENRQVNPLSQGQAMLNMLFALRTARGMKGAIDTTKWESFLRQASEFHAGRILADGWKPKSTNEGFLIAPLALASELFSEKRFLDAAVKAADHYIARHTSMDEPYWGGTLDATCEDKEGAWAALQGYLAIHHATKDAKYLTAAQHAADVVLSYVFVWDVALPPGRLSDHAFKTRGWTAVSAQNQHLDIYGVLCAPALWQLGELTNRPDLKQMAKLMTTPCGQLTDPWGGAGEQIHQTVYAQHYKPKPDKLRGVRGDYIEVWNIYWLTAHFLVSAAQFREMGVDVTTW